ncbi:MAG: hypothetical protein HY301_01530, partial [Verrucomicrobia bacterium]|nr:hypothetical protein [Verrucomicrobiota bacterium]
ILLAAFVAVTFVPAIRAVADEPIMSPRAKASQVIHVSGTTADMLDRNVALGSPAGRAFAHSLRTVPGTTEDRLNRDVGATMPKVRDLLGTPTKEFQVAPVK